MSSTTEVKRAPGGRSQIPQASTPLRRILGSPTAFIATAVILGGFLILLLPGVLAFRFFLPDGDPIAEGLGMVPGLSMLILLLTGTVVVAIARSPFDTLIAWITVLLSTAMGVVVFMRARQSRGGTSQF